MQTITTIFHDQDYTIYIGSGIMNGIGGYLRENYPGDDFVIVADEKVFSLHGKRFYSAFLPDQTVRLVILPPGEKNKNTHTLNQLYKDLLRLGTNRRSVIIALGGGVTGDIAGFAAATYMRGVRYIQIPTTLLAMVDSSVGGKTGVDLPEAKNLIGCFYIPNAVLIDPDFLRTLPEREMIAGFAEVLKYGITLDPSFLRWLKNNETRFMNLDNVITEKAVGRCCRLKNKLVAEDPFDRNRRKILNFGHTFGHALETLGGYSVLRHGEAVMLGMLMAVRLSEITGLIQTSEARPIRAFIEKYLPVIMERPAIKKFLKNLDVDRMIHYMQADKKKERQAVQLVLLQKPGQAIITDSCTVPQIRQAVTDTLQRINYGVNR